MVVERPVINKRNVCEGGLFSGKPDAENLVAMYYDLIPLMASGAIFFPVTGVYRFEQLSTEVAVAVKHTGKAILIP